MKIRVLDTPVVRQTPDLRPVEAARGTIHLVVPSNVSSPSPVVAPKFDVVGKAPRRSKHIRDSEKISTLALAGAALVAPLIWMGHALLVWLDLF